MLIARDGMRHASGWHRERGTLARKIDCIVYKSWKLKCDKASFQLKLEIKRKSRGEKKIRTRGMNDEMTGYRRGQPWQSCCMKLSGIAVEERQISDGR